MVEVIVLVIALIVGLATKGLQTQKEQEAAITEGYYNDRNFEQTKTLGYYQLLSEQKRNTLIILGVLIVAVFIISAFILLRKKEA